MTLKKLGRGIGEWPETERPRERLLCKGAESLSDSQLLAILLRVGRQDASAVKVGMDVLERVGGIVGLLHCSVEELCAIPGVGPAKAAQLKAAVEVGKRAVSAPLTTGMRINSSADLFKHYHARLRDLRHEIFAVVLLDAFKQWIGLQYCFQLLIELDGRQLQQAYGLLQLRREREVLGESELKALFHRILGSPRGGNLCRDKLLLRCHYE